MEVIKKITDITIAKVNIYQNGCVRFSLGATIALNLQEGDTISFYHDEEGQWYLKRFGGNVELRTSVGKKGLSGYHRGFAEVFLRSVDKDISKLCCPIATRPNDEGMYAIYSTSGMV